MKKVKPEPYMKKLTISQLLSAAVIFSLTQGRNKEWFAKMCQEIWEQHRRYFA